MRKQYTEPKISKGPEPKKIPSCSTKIKEWAKNDWCINFSYNGKQYRVKEGINRIKDAKQKQSAADALLLSVTNDLAAGFNPEKPGEFYEKNAKQSISLQDAVKNYITDIEAYLRKKTVQSYQSKLLHFADAYPDKQLKDITTNDIEKYIQAKIKPTKNAKMFMGSKVIALDEPKPWVQKTVSNARRAFSTFFVWCNTPTVGYLTSNPIPDIQLKKIKSEVEAPERNVPFSNEDAASILSYLDKNDRYTALYCRIIYYTCLRPGEISKLQVRDIDLTNATITVRLSVMKNSKKTKPDTVHIEPSLLAELKNLNLQEYPPNYYLMSNPDTLNFIGETCIGNNIPYKRFCKALESSNLTGKGYTQYAFKHYSNIVRFKDGWTLEQLMVLNRHATIEITVRYLAGIAKGVDITKKEAPRI